MYRTIIKLLYSSTNWLLRFSFFAFPIALLFSISSFLFIDNLFESYERYLINSYIGTQGRISIETTNRSLISELKKMSKRNHFIYSTREEFKANVIFKNSEKEITKFAKFIILDAKYLDIKFKDKGEDNYKFFVNETFLKSMGDINIKEFKEIYFEDKERSFKISRIIPIDTGFLDTKPIIFLSSSFAKKLFTIKSSDKIILEFLEKEYKNIKTIKDKTAFLAKEYNVLAFNIHDLILDTESTKKFFKKIFIVQMGITFLLILLSLGVILLSISIIIEFKKTSLKTLQLMGMSSRDLSLTLSITCLVIILIILGCTIFTVKIYQSIFLEISNFNQNFFIPLNGHNYVYIILFALFISIVVYNVSTYIFKGIKK